MLFLNVLGAVAFIFGILLILFPNALIKANTAMAKWLIDLDSFILKNRLGAGISFILTGACLWFIAYYMKAIAILRSLNQ